MGMRRPGLYTEGLIDNHGNTVSRPGLNAPPPGQSAFVNFAGQQLAKGNEAASEWCITTKKVIKRSGC